MADQVTETDEIREAVRARYAAAAENVGASGDPGSSCCGPADAVLSDEGARVFGASLYPCRQFGNRLGLIALGFEL